MERLSGLIGSSSMPTVLAGALAMCWIMTWDWLNRQGPLLAPERGRRGLFFGRATKGPIPGTNPDVCRKGGS
jgi:hypothetical protein